MLSFFRRDVLDEILNLIELVSEGFPFHSCANMQTIKATDMLVSCDIKFIRRDQKHVGIARLSEPVRRVSSRA